MLPMTFIDKLRKAQAAHESWLCVGLDPTPDQLPQGVSMPEFCRIVLEATADYVCAYKMNLAFYLAHGMECLQVLHDLIARVPDGVPVILDAKFGDISYTAQHYARAAFEGFGADAVTVTPYVGMDAVTPLLEYADRMIFVLVRSANVTGNDFQLWPSERAPLYRYVTAQVNTLARQCPDQLGIMISATQPLDLINVRSWAPTLPFLIPGLGVQQGDLNVAVEHGGTRTGLGPVISVTRSIIYASTGKDFAEAAHTAARDWRDRINAARRAQQSECC